MSYGGNDRRGVVNGVNWGLTSRSIVVVGLRLVSRGTSRSFGLDDALIIPALIIQIAYVALLSTAVKYGYGLHTSAISPPTNAPIALYWATVAQCLAVLTYALPKFAIVALLKRLLDLRLRTVIIFWTMATSLLIFSLALSISVPGTCWDPSVLLNYSYFIGAYSAFLDAFWAAFPPFVIMKLSMPLYKKIVISLALGGGFLACAVTIYKCTLLYQLGAAAKTDPTYADVPLLVWTAVETNVLIVAASLPTIGPFMRFVREKAITSLNWRTGSSRSDVRASTNWGDQKPRAHGLGKNWPTLTGDTTGMSRLSSEGEEDIGLVDLQQQALKDQTQVASVPRQAPAESQQGLEGREDPVEVWRRVDMQTTSRPTPESNDARRGYQFRLNGKGN